MIKSTRFQILVLLLMTTLSYQQGKRPATKAPPTKAPLPEEEEEEIVEGQPVDSDGITVPEEVESEFHTCRRFLDDGSVVENKYDQCTSFCCGGKILLKQESVKCCGSEELGTPYNEDTLSCCEWWMGQGKAYRSAFLRDHKYGCCGSHLITHSSQGCCYGDGPPEPFTKRREKCCGSNSVKLQSFFGDAACCGTTATFDRRRQSCPCNDGQVLNVRASKSECCKSDFGVQAPYIKGTQFCCEGSVGTVGKEFCCGSEIGTRASDVCCEGGIVVTVRPPDKTKTKCCGTTPFNPKKEMCCEGVVKAHVRLNTACCGETPYNPVRQICCEGSVWSRATDGTACCAQFAYFPEKQSFCHKGDVYFSAAVNGNAGCGDEFYFTDEGDFLCCNDRLVTAPGKDSCCDQEAYNSATEICCDGNIFDKGEGDVCCSNVPYFPRNTTICCDLGPSGHFHRPACCGGIGYDAAAGGVCCVGNIYEGFIWPSCCVDQGYDASTDTCCGATVHPNPRGSYLTACCGEIDPKPYDLISQLCCEGIAVPIPTGMNRKYAACCGDTGVYDPRTQLCCSGVPRNKADIYNTKCCGRETYDSSTHLCCDGESGKKPLVVISNRFGDKTACCGNVAFDTEQQYCCAGVLTKAKAGVTGCCAGKAYDRTKTICCNDRLLKIGRNVPWESAKCCGGLCMYDGPQYCCENRIYMGNARSKRTCDKY